MSSSTDKSSDSQTPQITQIFIYSGIAWAISALLFFLWFSITVPGEESRPTWYSIGTYIFEEGAFLTAAIFCFRNWRSPQIVSGRNVWLGIGLGMLFYFLGTLLFGYWELGLNQEPAVSPGDLFYLFTYIALGWGMVLAVISRKLNLEVWQWVITAAIAVIGMALAIWLVISTPSQEADSDPVPPAPVAVSPSKAKANPPATKKAPTVATKKEAVKEPETAKENIPAWVVGIENFLAPLKEPVNLFYVIADVVLLIFATMLLLAFWGGRFALSWRMIAAAAFCFYIGDVWFKYATDHIENYQSGFLLEVFWVFSGILFAIGAILEYDTSSRSSRRTSRKRA
jgi:hypothetical protein